MDGEGEEGDKGVGVIYGVYIFHLGLFAMLACKGSYVFAGSDYDDGRWHRFNLFMVAKRVADFPIPNPSVRPLRHSSLTGSRVGDTGVVDLIVRGPCATIARTSPCHSFILITHQNATPQSSLNDVASS